MQRRLFLLYKGLLIGGQGGVGEERKEAKQEKGGWAVEKRKEKKSKLSIFFERERRIAKREGKKRT